MTFISSVLGTSIQTSFLANWFSSSCIAFIQLLSSNAFSTDLGSTCDTNAICSQKLFNDLLVDTNYIVQWQIFKNSPLCWQSRIDSISTSFGFNWLISLFNWLNFWQFTGFFRFITQTVINLLNIWNLIICTYLRIFLHVLVSLIKYNMYGFLN